MSKEKAHKVVVHRIEFQRKERELIEQLTTAYTVNRVATPIVGLLSSPQAMIALAGSLALVGIVIDMNGLNDSSDMADIIDRYQSTYTDIQAEEKERIRDGGGQSFKQGVISLIMNVFGTVSGQNPAPEFNP